MCLATRIGAFSLPWYARWRRPQRRGADRSSDIFCSNMRWSDRASVLSCYPPSTSTNLHLWSF